MINFYASSILPVLRAGFLGPDAPSTGRPHGDTFLAERPLRFHGPELDRAIRLYHHQERLAGPLLERLPGLSRYDTVIVPLSERTPGQGPAHVLLQGSGAFLSCLSGEVRPGPGPVLPYAALAPLLEAEGPASEDDRTVAGQLQALSGGALLQALLRGPGHVTRQMVEIIEMRPATYVVPVALCFWHALNEHFHLVALQRGGKLARPYLVQSALADARIQLCLPLLALFGDPRVEAQLATLARHVSPYAHLLMVALARPAGGGEHLVGIVGDPEVPELCRMFAMDLLTLHTLLHPQGGPALRRRLAALRDVKLDPHALQRIEEMVAVPIEVVEEVRARYADGPEEAVDQIPEPSGVPGIPGRRRLYQAMLKGPSLAWLYPDQAETPRVCEQWAEHLHRARPDRPKGVPVVNAGPRTGRNDPCPCGSGRKHKQCCLGRPAHPDAR